MRSQYFIVPGEDIARRHFHFRHFLEEWHLSWEDFIRIALEDLLDHLNRMGVDQLRDDGVDIPDYLPCCVQQVLEALDVVDPEAEPDKHQRIYVATEALMRDVLGTMFHYLPMIFDEENVPGLLSEVVLQRTIGYDLAFRATYLTRPVPA